MKEFIKAPLAADDLHNGTNLGSKKFVAAKGEPGPDASVESGVLILSEFTNAAQDLPATCPRPARNLPQT